MHTAVELGRVPDGFVGDLRHPDRMRCRARRSSHEAVLGDGVVHMGLMVGAVKVLSVPASKGLVSID